MYIWGTGLILAVIPELHSGCEGLMLRDGEDQQETLPTAEIVVSDGSVVLLASCVKNVNLDLLPIQNYLFPVAVCLGGLIVLHKLRIEKRDIAKYFYSEV